MKRKQLQTLAHTVKKGFLVGALLSLCVYAFARILFYEFSFTAQEEVINFFKIVIAGGVLVSAALVTFLLLEMGLQFLMTLRISFPSFNLRSSVNNNEMADYPLRANL